MDYIEGVSKHGQYIFISSGISQGFTLHFTVLDAVKNIKKNVISSRGQCISKLLSSIHGKIII